MAQKAKIAFVGCGGHATSALYPCIPMIEEFELVAVCDLKEELARRNARNYGALRYYTDLKTMLQKEQLDGVATSGPPQMHCEVGKLCLEAGLPIFVEKPSAISYREACELAELAEKKSLWASVAYMKRYFTCYNIVKSIVEDESFGGISALEARFSNGPYPAIWRIEENARAFLIGQVVHIFDLIRFFAGEVEEIYAHLNRLTNDRFAYSINVRFENGAVGVLNLNAVEAPVFKVTERLALSGYDCWVEAIDMLRVRYHPRQNPIAGFERAGRTQTVEWAPVSGLSSSA